MSDDAMWTSMTSPTPGVPAQLTPMMPASPMAASTGAVAPAGGLPTLEPLTTQSGLTRRVRGAQMPELGSMQVEAAAPRPAEEVRSTLASLQRGVDLGRQRHGDS